MAKEILGHRNVLDHGYVDLLDLMGDDAEAARAARISYGTLNARPWEQDAKLTRYLYENHHTSPFEMIELKFRMKLPIFVARQIIRHRTANVNEFSMRYADPSTISDSGEDIDYYVPKEWRKPDAKNKQGSIPFEKFDNYSIFVAYEEGCEESIRIYKELQATGVANEMARMILPVSVYTLWVWKNDLHNILHFLRLRTDSHASWETQQYAFAMVELIREQLPLLMEVVWPNE